MTPLVEDREMLRARLATTIDVIKSQPEVDAATNVVRIVRPETILHWRRLGP